MFVYKQYVWSWICEAWSVISPVWLLGEQFNSTYLISPQWQLLVIQYQGSWSTERNIASLASGRTVQFHVSHFSAKTTLIKGVDTHAVLDILYINQLLNLHKFLTMRANFTSTYLWMDRYLQIKETLKHVSERSIPPPLCETTRARALRRVYVWNRRRFTWFLAGACSILWKHKFILDVVSF